MDVVLVTQQVKEEERGTMSLVLKQLLVLFHPEWKEAMDTLSSQVSIPIPIRFLPILLAHYPWILLQILIIMKELARDQVQELTHSRLIPDNQKRTLHQLHKGQLLIIAKYMSRLNIYLKQIDQRFQFIQN